MLKSFISIFFMSLIPLSTFAQIQGKVYLDTNGNGICDVGEKGMKGVCVQD